MFNFNFDIKYYILCAIAALVALTVHEFSHGYAASKMGDNTARMLGRLTFNPLKHMDILGTVSMVFFGFGWAKPVPVDARNFKNPKRGFAITALAGPLANLILGFLFAGIYLLYHALLGGVAFEEGFVFNLAQTVSDFLWIFFTLNIGLAVFNLIPVPPLDGSRILHVVLPERLYFKLMQHERKIYLFMIIWLILGDGVCTAARSLAFVQSTPWLYTALGVLSLSEIVGYAVGAVASLIIKFWTLIPFLR
jgi:Zn-dependent protease